MKNNGEINRGYLLKKSGYMVTGVGGKSALAHRVISYTFNGRPPIEDDEHWVYYTCDHVNGNRSDNRSVNLRWATNAEQKANIGLKRHNLLKPGEQRVLRKTPLNPAPAVSKVQYGTPTSELVYQEYVQSWLSVDEIAQNGGRAVSTIRSYICKHYSPIHATVFHEKLGLDIASIERAFTVMTAGKMLKVSDPSIKSSSYTSDIHEQLGANCTDLKLATQLLPKMYEFFCL